jgi:endogenous inhibitor of DNA gyrase (YacG/DUF329 family)
MVWPALPAPGPPGPPEPDPTVRGIRCPVCGRTVGWRDNPARPFCTATCKLIDLGAWLDGRRVIAGEGAPEAAPERPSAGP